MPKRSSLRLTAHSVDALRYLSKPTRDEIGLYPGCAALRMTILVASIGLMFVHASTPHAQTMEVARALKIGKALPGEKCRISPPNLPTQWSDSEKWAWTEICEERDADFSRHLNEWLDPKDPHQEQKWSDGRRTLSSGFLKSILLHEPFRSAVPDRGVRIVGAYIQHNVDLSDAVIQRPLTFHNSLFNAAVTMSRLTTPTTVAFVESRSKGKLNMDSVYIGGNLFLRNAKFVEVHLAGARIQGQLSTKNSKFSHDLNMTSASIGKDLLIQNTKFVGLRLTGAVVGGQLSMDGSIFSGPLDMDAISIKRSLHMRRVQCAEVRLVGATISGQVTMESSTFHGPLTMDALSTLGALKMNDNANFREVRMLHAVVGSQLVMDGSTFKGRLDMDNVHAGNDLLMRNAKFREVHQVGATIGGQLSLDGSKFTGKVILDSVSISRDLFMRNAEFDGAVSIVFVRIGSNLDTRGARLGKLDLTGTKVKNELQLGSAGFNIKWGNHTDKTNSVRPPRLILSNTTVGTLRDTKDAWPHDLEWELEGFTYARLSRHGTNKKQAADTRNSAWFIDWLARDTTYSPQSYRQLAHVLREAGRESEANDILFALQERRRTHNATPLFGKVLLIMSWLLLGYGYKVWLALVWIFGLVLVGVGIISIPRETRSKSIWHRFFYSLESAVPLVGMSPLNQEFSKNIAPWVDRYFQIHKIIGLVIISVLIAGLTGLVT